MDRIRIRRVSPAMVISCIALFVSLGGVGYAAATIGSSQIKNNAVQGKDIKNSSVTGKDIKTGSVSGSDIKNNGLTGTDVNESTLGQVPSAAQAASATNAGNAGSVDGKSANELVRSAFGTRTTSLALTGTTATAIETPITVPAAGYLLVTTNNTYNATATALIHCGIDVDDATAGSWPGTYPGSASKTAGAFDSCTPSARFPVTAGTHTVRYKAHNDGGGTLAFAGGSLTVLYEPFDATGVQGTGTALRGSSGGDTAR